MKGVLLPATCSVVDGLEMFELQYAKDQPEYNPIRVLLGAGDDGRVIQRWTFTDEQRAAVAAGADLFLEMLTFHKGLTPVRLRVADALDKDETLVLLKITEES